MNHKDTINFQCNICGTHNTCSLNELSRESDSCSRCHSTVRMRSIIHLLSINCFGESLILPEFPTKKEIHGVGMSDWETYANQLEEKLDYSNTFYHQEPRLDITDIKENIIGTMDFVISTDVYEHVLYPVNRAFQNTLKLLKPSGVFIFTVPFTKEGENTLEHFGQLHDFTIEQTNDKYVLKDNLPNGSVNEFRDLIFHGGPGSTLEMRIFSEKSLLKELNDAGFKDIKIHSEPFMKYGIYWGDELWSLPITAKS